MLLLATAACLCVSAAAADKDEWGGDWYGSFDITSWKSEPWKTSLTCSKGGNHVSFTDDDSGAIIMGAFGDLVRADVKYEHYKIDAECNHTDGIITLECCKNCHVWYISETTVRQKNENHDWVHRVEAATCQKEGKEYDECTRCGATKEVKTLAKTDHTYSEVVTKKAVCDVEGELTKTCKVCGYTVKEAIPALTHDYQDNAEDCTTLICKNCGGKKPSGKQHTVTEWEILGARTPKGTHKGVCTVCGTTVKEMHDSIVDDGDCTTPVVCKCGFILVEGSGGHNLLPKFKDETSPYWEYVEIAGGKHSRQCSNPGCEQPTYVDVHEAGKGTNCSLCGDTAVSDETAPDTTTAAPAETTTPSTTEAVTTETAAPATTEAPTPETTEAVTSSEPHIGTVAPEPAKDGEVIVELGEETDAKINVDNITKTNLTVKNIVEEKFTEYAAYDINLVKDGAKVQPDGTVKVSIALPEGWSDVDVYHVDAGVMTKLETTVKDGYAIFNTTHFSVYVLVNNKSAATPASTETTGETAPADDIVPAPEASAETTGAFDGYEPDENTLLISPAPKTGELPDMTLAVTVTLVTSLLAASALIIVGKKGRK